MIILKVIGFFIKFWLMNYTKLVVTLT